MEYIENLTKKGKIGGLMQKEKEEFTELFGEIYIGNPFDDPEKYHLTKASNYYSDSSGSKPLYILSPIGFKIKSVWPDDITRYKKIKLGTSDLGVVGLYLQLPNGVGLYVALEPHGNELGDKNSFGI